jgi:hypothetical protein
LKKVVIQKGILNDLKAFTEKYNETLKPKLKLDVAVFFIGLINELNSHYRGCEEKDDYSPVDSQILKHYHSNYNKYFEFFTDYEILLKSNYGADIGKSNSYKIEDKYSKNELISYEIIDKRLNSKFNEKGLDKNQQKKLDFSIQKRPHLMKIFNDNMTIDFISAEKQIAHLKDTEPNRYKNSEVLINEFKNKSWKASFRPYNSDYRLHTNLTRSPKALRKHILINNENIIGYDVKTSQPYFFCVVLKAILKKDKSLLEKIGATKIFNGSTIEQLFDLELNIKEINDFVFSVTDKNIDFYDSFASKLDIRINEKGQPFRKVSNFKTTNKGKSRSKQNKNSEEQKVKVFKTKRDLAKEIVMEVFYSSPNSKITEAAMFRKAYPNIHKIIKCIVNNNVKFYQLLTTIEAYILLDIVAKKINSKYPCMPLGSIHDCLITTTNYKKILKEEMFKQINDATTLKVNIELEEWKQ